MRLYKPPLPSLRQLEGHFERMASYGFNTARPLVWSYFFTHWSRLKLLEFRWKLETLGYGYLGLDEAPQREDMPPRFRLRVEKTAQQSPKMLLDHLKVLCDLAAAAGVDYQGWEVGRLPH